MTSNNNSNTCILILPKIEIIIYFIIYVTFISYAVFNVYVVSEELPKSTLFGFERGWSFIGRYRDTLGDEWEHAKSFIFKNYIWYIGHILITELFRYFNIKEFYIIHSIIGLMFLFFSYRILVIITVLFELICFYIVSKLYIKSIIWLNALIWLAVINTLKKGIGPYSDLNNDEFLQLILILAWNLLKCLSFSLNQTDIIRMKKTADTIDIHTNKSDMYNWKTYFGYVLYFPTMIFGPCMIFDRYIQQKYEKFNYRFMKFLKNIFRTLFWALFYNFSLHFFYVHYLSYDLQKVKDLYFWAFYGYGYLMGQFFHLQYIVSYGLSNSLAQFDGINTPNQPKCIAHVHLYSNMWKYFDHGLYEFLFRYIYAASCSKTSSLTRKFAASLLTFTFIYVWHGLMTFILIWTIMNFICLIFEKLLRYYLIQTDCNCKLIIQKYIGKRNHLRFYALLGSQLFILAAFSNFYFFSNIEIGNYFLLRTYTENIFNYLIVTIWCYCIFQCSEYISYYEMKK